MLYDASVLPGGSYPRPTRSSSPSKIVGEVVQGLRQPSRLRGRMVVTVLVGGAMLVFMFLTRRHVRFSAEAGFSQTNRLGHQLSRICL